MNHLSDENFFGKEWRIFLNYPRELWGKDRETITLYDGDGQIVDELTYRLREPGRGEVIVFKFPKDTSQYYIKRIVALPGETIEIHDKKIIIYNQGFKEGVVLDESSYLANGLNTWGDIKVILASNEYFVLGDNRGASSDSRQWGVLPQKDIIGRVWIRAWPFEKAEVF